MPEVSSDAIARHVERRTAAIEIRGLAIGGVLNLLQKHAAAKSTELEAIHALQVEMCETGDASAARVRRQSPRLP